MKYIKFVVGFTKAVIGILFFIKDIIIILAFFITLFQRIEAERINKA